MAEDEVTVGGPAEHDHDHDHEHDHDHGAEEEYVVDEALVAEGEQLLTDAVGQLAPADVERLLKGLNPTIGNEVVKDLIGNKLDPRRLKNLGGLLVGPLRKRSGPRLSLLVERLSMGILGTFESELGSERFENPSADDLREVLDAVLAQHPTAGVRCTLSWVVAEGMRAAEAARDVLKSDERLRLPEWAEATT